MNDTHYFFLVTIAKYFLLNLIVFFIYMFLAGTLNMLFNSLLIVNCTAIIMGKLQKIHDLLNEMEKKEENSKNNA